MAGLTIYNPLPLKVGGGPSNVGKIHNVYAQAMGQGGTAAAGTIEHAWRLAQARGIRAGLGDARAISQFWPDLATDLLPVYETILGLTHQVGDSEEARRQAITDRWTEAVTLSDDGLEDELQKLNELFSVVSTDEATATVTEMGRGFEDWSPSSSDACGPPFGGTRTYTDWPNFSDHFVTKIQYGITATQLTQADKRIIEEAKARLNRLLPAWIAFQVSLIAVNGFVLDQSFLDLTGLTTT
jgi:hypothetical protein